MKILAIRGKNLASLEGEFEVDFTQEPLRSAGIFAITGSTGAGKSTILDALCLALFDDTPRTNRAKESVSIPDVKDRMINQKDSRTILRRGMGEGYAEVDFFSLGGDKYRSTWMVKRARGKADGSMQNSEIRLLNLSVGVEEQGRKTDLLARIVELIGLTFDQFTRSVLLAQGDFATFLKARQSEKAELLEKLTGTEIYSRISVAVFERTKQAEQDYRLLHTRMNEVELLPEERLADLVAEKQAVMADCAMLREEVMKITEQIKWIAEEERIRNSVHETEEQMHVLEEQIKAATPRYDYLFQIDEAQEIRDGYTQWQQTSRLLAEKQSILVRQRAEAQANVEALKQTGELLEGYIKELQVFNENVARIQPQMIQARELDVRIRGGQEYLSGVHKELAVGIQSKEKLERSIVLHNREIADAIRSMANLEQWFEANRMYESLVPRAELVCNLLDDIELSRQQLAENRRILTDCRNVQEKDQEKLTQLKQEAGRLQQLLPAEIVEWRARLQEGEPCPVCGSTHHPLGRVTSEQSLQEEELEEAKKQITIQVEALVAKMEQRQNDMTRLETLIGNYERHLGQMLEKAETYFAEWPDWEKRVQDAGLQKELKKLTAQWLANVDTRLQLNERLKQGQITVEMELRNQAEVAEVVNEKNNRCAVLTAELGKLEQERVALLKGKTVEQVEEACNKKKKELEEQLKICSERRSSYQGKEEAFRAAILQTEQEVVALGVQNEGLKQTIDYWLGSGKKISSWDKLAEILARDLHWIQEEKHFLTGLREKQTALKATLAERHLHLLQHQAADIKPQTEEESRESLQAQLDEKNGLIGKKSTRQAEIGVLLANHERGKEKIKAFEQELQAKEGMVNNWRKLNELFGSATGSKFKEIAQGYTLDVLLTYANKHLKSLSERYELQRIPDTLALQVIDLDMLGETRAVHSLSGGESFLISLALALALASLSSNRMNVESLFIDEGFGSLDMDTLRIALDALERLQTQGRKIGVISHVTEMTERITAQIQVLKTSNGRSEIKIVG